MKTLLLRSVLMTCMFAPTVGVAQLAPGYSGYSSAPTAANLEEYWYFMRELGRCFVRTKKGKAEAFLNTNTDTPQEKSAFDALFNRNGNNPCMQNMVHATIVRGQLRGTVAEALYKTRLIAQPSQPVPAGLVAPKNVKTMKDFADCYVAAHYGAARDLLDTTQLGTKEESKQVRSLASEFSACLPQGDPIKISAPVVRLAFAEALYRASVPASNSKRGN